MFHAFCEGQARNNNGMVEILLKDGTWYPMQKKMEEIDESYNGIKWVSFNCGKGEEPRFAGLTMSGLGMKKAAASAARMTKTGAAGAKPFPMKVGRPPAKKNGGLIFTFASREGEARTVDLSHSIPAWFRGKILGQNNGKFDITGALSNMPAFVGFTTVSKVLPAILSGLNGWNDEKK